LQEAGVEVLGTPIPVIIATYDREFFLGKSYSATNIDEAVVAAENIGYPVLIRAAFALGGLGSAFEEDDEELWTMGAMAFSTSDQILVDQDLRVWKEL
jgi:carbamoylphosphate synthase large subunit